MRLQKLCNSTLYLSLSVFPLLAQAADMNDLDECVLIPRVVWQAARPNNISTTVGLINRDAGTIYWGFYDGDGDVRASGLIPDTPTTTTLAQDTLTPFIWDPDFNNRATGLGGVTGYLLFCLDEDNDEMITTNDSGELGANAFFIDRAASDVAYIPTIAVDANDLRSTTPDLVDRPIADISAGSGPGALIDIQYLIDGFAGGDDTEIYFFTVDDPGNNLSVDFLNGAGGVSLNGVSVPAGANLTVLDPEAFAAPPTIAPNGFVGWTVPGSATRAFVFSIADSPTFGAIQTLMGNTDD